MSDDLIIDHKKKILSEILWFLSAADGKYSTRFRSKKVVDLANADSKSQERIQHEHVYLRKTVLDKLLDNLNFYRNDHEALEFLLDETVGCIVTENEHKFLLKDKVGWSRYKNVLVFDMSVSPPELLVIAKDE